MHFVLGLELPSTDPFRNTTENRLGDVQTYTLSAEVTIPGDHYKHKHEKFLRGKPHSKYAKERENIVEVKTLWLN